METTDRLAHRRFRGFVSVLLALAVTSGLAGCGSSSTSGDPAQQPSAGSAAPAEPSGTSQSSASESGEQLASNQLRISRQDFGDDWPFTVDEGVLTGDGSGGVGEVTFTADGVTYAVNGTAKGNGKYAEIDAIWADNPSIPGTKKNIGPIIDRGLELCR